MSDHPHVKAIRVKHFWLFPGVGGQPEMLLVELYKPGEPGAEGPDACGVEKPYLSGLDPGPFADEETEARH